MIYKTLILFMAANFAFATNYLDENLKKLNWNGVDVIWLEDESLPTYDVTVYFREGALGDDKIYSGETEMMFNQLSSGTDRFSQKEIIEALEFYGADYSFRVTHEFSTFSLSGLVKDIVPTMKMVCHLFSDAKFPTRELKRTKSRIISALKSSVSNHSALANMAFRYEALKGSGYETPAGGTIDTISKISSKRLSKRLEYFNKNALKRIYVKGPNDINQMESIIKNDCDWKKVANVREIPEVKKIRESNEVIFVPVPNANQAQVLIGRIMTASEVRSNELDYQSFAANFLGSGFTSKLFQSLRVQKGLTYSVSAYVSDQYSYGRSGIMTFTKNETLIDLLNATKSTIESVVESVNANELQLAKKSIKGKYLIGLESTSDFLQTLMQFDHVKRDYADIYRFSENIDKLSANDLQRVTKQIYGWEKQTILVLGNKSLVNELKKAGFKVKVKKFTQYL